MKKKTQNPLDPFDGGADDSSAQDEKKDFGYGLDGDDGEDTEKVDSWSDDEEDWLEDDEEL